jgi:hypothetical protein
MKSWYLILHHGWKRFKSYKMNGKLGEKIAQQMKIENKIITSIKKLKSWTCTKNETMKKCIDSFTQGGHLV